MGRIRILAAAVVLALLACWPTCEVRGKETDDVLTSLVEFLATLAGGDPAAPQRIGWNASVDPCAGTGVASQWGKTVTCFDTTETNAGHVKKIELEALGLSGTIDAASLCAAPALRVVSLQGNALRGELPAGVSACSGLTHLYVDGNRLSGPLPGSSVSQLRKLLVLDVSRNDFSGELPAGLSAVHGLKRFIANDNQFVGTVPDFNLPSLENFTVSNNNLTGPIPQSLQRFGSESFSGNAAGMCGEPALSACPLPPPNDETADQDEEDKESKSRRTRRVLMYLGYALLGAVILGFVVYKICSRKRKNKLGRKSRGGKVKDAFDSSDPTTTTTMTASKSASAASAYSLPASVERSAAAAPSTSSLVVLRRSGTASVTSTAAAAAAKELRFEDLLKSPAELLGRGRYGSSYKVVVPSGAALAVKRVKDASVSDDEFRRRMERVARARHPAVLPPLAFYCAAQEKLVVYEFLANGSLAKILHGSIESSQAPLDWPARLHIAAKVADGMAFMHSSLRGDGSGSYSSSSTPSTPSSGEAATDGANANAVAVAHGSLKSSNILFTASMEPCVSEYGVIAPPPQLGGGSSRSSGLRADVRAYGVLLLELLTGKCTAAQGDGAELARWVTSVIREEWTAEVFDRALLSRGAAVSEQRMVQLLQVAMRCVEASPGEAPPTMREVAGMVNAIVEEDDRSLSAEA
ncbi:putative inactive receptor-like protein kinase At1g64210 [Brachypodium distachyon]|uniref:Protein kinase domain-containing protein n=1 Tax=Brachypodium distachyon TaxID=15368 RepID=I1IPU0_BRADI|nr:putative inactive receptor-like protein kinase At1g64210 [Brachypodium distachyon]KQJ90086.1 hypothetical protein BRADI_4g29330v3 [Brachypodium distachyon]|eukprot:XP_003576482.1 putative inactive receptor-like protein kinase At1g64210 [Brachypodium distachyon]